MQSYIIAETQPMPDALCQRQRRSTTAKRGLRKSIRQLSALSRHEPTAT